MTLGAKNIAPNKFNIIKLIRQRMLVARSKLSATDPILLEARSNHPVAALCRAWEVVDNVHHEIVDITKP